MILKLFPFVLSESLFPLISPKTVGIGVTLVDRIDRKKRKGNEKEKQKKKEKKWEC